MTAAWASFFSRPVQSSGAVHQLGSGKQKDSGFPQRLSERDSHLLFIFFFTPLSFFFKYALFLLRKVICKL